MFAVGRCPYFREVQYISGRCGNVYSGHEAMFSDLSCAVWHIRPTREKGQQEAVSWIIIKLIYSLDQFLYPASVIGHLTGEIGILCTIGMDFSTIHNGNSIWTASFL